MVTELTFRVEQLQDTLDEQGSSTTAQVSVVSERPYAVCRLHVCRTCLRMQDFQSVNDIEICLSTA